MVAMRVLEARAERRESSSLSPRTKNNKRRYNMELTQLEMAYTDLITDASPATVRMANRVRDILMQHAPGNMNSLGMLTALDPVSQIEYLPKREQMKKYMNLVSIAIRDTAP